MSIQIKMAVQIMVVEGGGKSTHEGNRRETDYVVYTYNMRFF